MILGILFLIVFIIISVGIHEFGHLIPAKAFGVRVPQYFIGFGPTLFSRRIGTTEYGVKALPLGGYVKLSGMYDPVAPEGVNDVKKNGTLTLAGEARAASAETIAPGEEAHAFYRLHPAKRLVVMFGGPLTNLILAFVAIVIVVMAVGAPVPSNELSRVSSCITEPCKPSAPPAPAAAAGLRPGDTILAWGQTTTPDWVSLQQAIQSTRSAKVTVRYLRDGAEHTTTVTPVTVNRPNPQRPNETITVPFVGISPAMEMVAGTFGDALSRTGALARDTAGIIVRLPVKLWNVVTSLGGGHRDANGVVGIVGVADVAGTIATAHSATYTWQMRLADLLTLFAALNMSFFIFNLIPLPPLDGGHILTALYDLARRGVARVRHAPTPRAPDTARLMPLSQTVMAFFIGMTILLIIADIINPVV